MKRAHFTANAFAPSFPRKGQEKQQTRICGTPSAASPLQRRGKQKTRLTTLGCRYRRADEKSIVILSSLGMCCRHLTPERSNSLRDAFMLVVSWYCNDNNNNNNNNNKHREHGRATSRGEERVRGGRCWGRGRGRRKKRPMKNKDKI